MLRSLLIASIAILTCAMLQGQAGEKGKTEESLKLDPAVESVNDLTMAFRLVEFGRKTKSPEALITAAGVLQRVPPATALKVDIKADDGKVVTADALPSMKEEAESLLKEAKAMAKNDKVIQDLADAVGNRTVKRGAIGGPRVIASAVPKRGTHTFNIPAVPGVPFVVNFRSPKNIPLHVIISYTGHFKGFSEDMVLSNQVMVVGHGHFVPPANFKGSIHIVVRNPNLLTVPYQIGTN